MLPTPYRKQNTIRPDGIRDSSPCVPCREERIASTQKNVCHWNKTRFSHCTSPIIPRRLGPCNFSGAWSLLPLERRWFFVPPICKSDFPPVPGQAHPGGHNRFRQELLKVLLRIAVQEAIRNVEIKRKVRCAFRNISILQMVSSISPDVAFPSPHVLKESSTSSWISVGERFQGSTCTGKLVDSKRLIDICSFFSSAVLLNLTFASDNQPMDIRRGIL